MCAGSDMSAVVVSSLADPENMSQTNLVLGFNSANSSHHCPLNLAQYRPMSACRVPIHQRAAPPAGVKMPSILKGQGLTSRASSEPLPADLTITKNGSDCGGSPTHFCLHTAECCQRCQGCVFYAVYWRTDAALQLDYVAHIGRY